MNIKNQELTLEALEQAADNDAFWEELAEYTESRFLLSAPGHLKSSVMEQCRGKEPAIQRSSKNSLLFFYTLKVGAAAAFCIFFLAAAPSRPVFADPLSSLSAPNISIYQKAQQITEQLNQFTNIFSRWEVNFNDKKEK